MKFAITIFFVLAVFAQMSFNAAAPYGYTKPEKTVAAPTGISQPQTEVIPESGKTCGCGSGCKCGSAAPSSSCGCTGGCHCGEPKTTPKPACKCGGGCSCSAKAGGDNCGCKKQASPSIDQSVLDRIRALVQSFRQ